jgi:hypothetical protein
VTSAGGPWLTSLSWPIIRSGESYADMSPTVVCSPEANKDGFNEDST